MLYSYRGTLIKVNSDDLVINVYIKWETAYMMLKGKHVYSVYWKKRVLEDNIYYANSNTKTQYYYFVCRYMYLCIYRSIKKWTRINTLNS